MALYSSSSFFFFYVSVAHRECHVLTPSCPLRLSSVLILRKRPDVLGELAFGQCHSSLGNGGPRKWPGWHARLPFAARRCEVNRPRQEIMGKRAAVPRQ